MQSNSTPKEPPISFQRVSRFYRPNRAALYDISFNIYPGEFAYIAGPSGAGKSTLLRLIYGAEVPDTGAVFYAGIDMSALKPRAISLIRRSMGIIFQDYRLIPDLPVGANVALPLEVAGMRPREIRTRVTEMLDRVGLRDQGAENAGNLSGGEQQRAAIARALIGDPAIVLADEPTGSLDAYNADFVLDLLEKTTEQGTTVVLATHDRMLMAARPHRTIVINHGRMTGMSSDGTESLADWDQPRDPSGLKQTG